MREKAIEILEEYANAYSDFDVNTLTDILTEIKRETATNFFKDLIRQANFHGEKDIWFNYERLVTVAKQYGVEVEE